MTQPGRGFAQGSSGYKYSINGQEKSDELGENLTSALYWEYDSRISKRWNIDPKQKVNESPFLCFSGNPILLSDILGDKASTPNDWVKDKNGNWIWKEEIKSPSQATEKGYSDYRKPESIVDNPDYNKIDPKTGVADGNKKIMLGKQGVIFVGILGLNVKSNNDAQIRDGHAWITIHDIELKEQINSYGLWPSDNPLGKGRSVRGSDVYLDIEKDRGDKATASCFKGITKEQQKLFYLKINENVKWENTYTCASWAVDCFNVITSIKFNATESVMGTTTCTPRVLDKSMYSSKTKGINLYPENRGKNDSGSWFF